MREISYSQALAEGLHEEMVRDPSIFLAGEDVGVYGGDFGVTKGLQKEFGKKRCFDTPITESLLAGLAVGAAAMGLRPVIEFMFNDFMTCAMDQIVNQAAKMRFMFGGVVKLPLVYRTHFGAGFNAAAQHSQSLESWFVHTPGLYVVAPSTAYDVKGLIKSSIRDDNPVVFLEHIFLYDKKGEVPEAEYIVPIGKAQIRRQGKDITIIGYANMANLAVQAAEKLITQGIDAEVLDLRTLKPFDEPSILSSVRKTGRVLVLQEAPRLCGVAAEISAFITENAFKQLKGPIMRLTGYDAPMPFSPPLEKFYLPDVDKIVEYSKKVMAY